MPRELKNAKISHVSYVDKAANKKRFLMTKAEDSKPVFEKEVKILTKSDDAQHLVYGIVYEPNVVDSQGDYMTASEIEKAAHEFIKEYRNIDTQHNFESGAGEVVECYIAPTDMSIGSEQVSKGSWILVTEATEEVWLAIQKGEITGYSMAGTAETLQKAEDEKYKSFFNMVKDFFTGTLTKQVEEVKDVEKQENELEVEFMVTELTKVAEIVKAGKQISAANMASLKTAHDILAKLVANGVIDAEDAKDGGADEKTEDAKGNIKKELSQEELLSSLIAEALAPLNEKIAKLETPEVVEIAETTMHSEEEVERLSKMISKAISEAIAPIGDRLEVIEKTKGISKQLKVEATIAKTEDNKPISHKTTLWGI